MLARELDLHLTTLLDDGEGADLQPPCPAGEGCLFDCLDDAEEEVEIESCQEGASNCVNNCNGKCRNGAKCEHAYCSNFSFTRNCWSET